MTSDKIIRLKRQLSKEELKNTKLMWKYANWEWRIIIILGIICLSYLIYFIGQKIGNFLN